MFLILCEDIEQNMILVTKCLLKVVQSKVKRKFKKQKSAFLFFNEKQLFIFLVEAFICL